MGESGEGGHDQLRDFGRDGRFSRPVGPCCSGGEWSIPSLSVLKLLQLLSRAPLITEELKAEPTFADPTDLGQ